MAKITLSNGVVFEGTVAECNEFKQMQENGQIATTVSSPKKPKKGDGNATPQPTVEKAVSLKQTLYSTNIKDYEPKKVGGFYKWGKKGDTVKSRNYRAMMTAYCYAVATKGKALGCYDSKGNKICDFDEIKAAYEKAKAAFQKAYPYVKTADRK